MGHSEELSARARTFYDVAGVRISVLDPELVLTSRLERLYGHARVREDGRTPDLAIEVNTDCRRPTEPPDEPVLHMIFDRPLRGYLLHGGLWLSDGRNATWVDYEAGEIRFDIAARDDAALYLLAHNVFPIALGELLRTVGRYCLHAAALARPSGTGILLLGDSNVGKSTLCYRALTIGHRCVADDGLVLREDGEVAMASALYRELCLDPTLLRAEDRDRAREIEPSLTGPRHRVELDPESWADRCAIDSVWLLERARGEGSSLRPASSVELLAELARQNRRLLLHPGLAEAHLAFLARLIGTTRGWVARLGSGMLTEARALEELLSR